MGPPLGSLCTASLVTFAESNMHQIQQNFTKAFLYVEVAWFWIRRNEKIGAPRIPGQALLLWRIYSGQQGIRKKNRKHAIIRVDEWHDVG